MELEIEVTLESRGLVVPWASSTSPSQLSPSKVGNSGAKDDLTKCMTDHLTRKRTSRGKKQK